MRLIPTAAALGALTFTSACVLTGIDPADLGAKAGALAELEQDLPDYDPDDGVPADGEARYAGNVAFFLQDGFVRQLPEEEGGDVIYRDGTAILGDAHLVVDFGDASVTGTMDDFEVAEFLIADLDDPSFQGLEDWEPAAGQLVLANGRLENTKNIYADFAGDITTAQHVYTLNGGLWGLFHGPDGAYLRARGDQGFGQAVLIDGVRPDDAQMEMIVARE